MYIYIYIYTCTCLYGGLQDGAVEEDRLQDLRRSCLHHINILIT